jgi:hypothetical protein
MNKPCAIVLLAAFCAGIPLPAYEARINLSGRKDRIIPTANRVVVLEVADDFLEKDWGEYQAAVASLPNPFTFDRGKKADTSSGVITVDQQPERAVEYDDASLLEAVAPGFSAQVRGFLNRSGKDYLQLAGGRLMTVGDTFPVRLPGLKKDSFEITISAISRQGYTLSLNEAKRFQAFEDFGGDNEGAVRYISD